MGARTGSRRISTRRARAMSSRGHRANKARPFPEPSAQRHGQRDARVDFDRRRLDRRRDIALDRLRRHAHHRTRRLGSAPLPRCARCDRWSRPRRPPPHRRARAHRPPPDAARRARARRDSRTSNLIPAIVVAPPAAAASMTTPTRSMSSSLTSTVLRATIVAKRLPAVRVVELRLQLVADRADRILRHARLLDFLQHGRHRRGVLLLRLCRVARARLGGNRHERTIRAGRDDGLAVRHDRWAEGRARPADWAPAPEPETPAAKARQSAARNGSSCPYC